MGALAEAETAPAAAVEGPILPSGMHQFLETIVEELGNSRIEEVTSDDQ